MKVTATVALLSLAFGVACTSAPLTLPGPILGLNDKAATRAAILEGMAVRGWVVEEEAGSRVLARIDRRSHVAKVWIDYSGKQIEFSYGGSDGLECVEKGDSCRSIHRNYNRWARDLALDISRKLTERRVVGGTASAA